MSDTSGCFTQIPPVAQSFHNVYSKCPKLAHFAFDGKNTPSVGSSAGRTLEKGYLSRLSICSPILLEDEFFRSGPPISYELITHLHIFAPGGLGDRNFYNEVFVEHMHQLGSLSHLVIEITYPSPAMLRSDKYEIIFGDALFNINLSDSLIRNFFVRVPSLREVVVKSIPPYPSFRNLWDGLKAALKDEPRIIFMQTMDDKQKAHCESALSDKSAAVCSSAWQDLLVNALDEVDQYWSSEQ
ncbi:hypothetical protein EW145_g5414 [Phellinidium pouzarii]|uniref:Uncharacterized protein n=1 Tax=Phellinidium pouzarii TaxID=167371 RepID=A0A4S4L1E2_9AGAM|nr:hypothetical protein EW145_g5414 [Phellinidium pouzarii]